MCHDYNFKRGEKETTEGIEVSNQGKIRTVNIKATTKNNYNYLGILDLDSIKQTQMEVEVKTLKNKISS